MGETQQAQWLNLNGSSSFPSRSDEASLSFCTDHHSFPFEDAISYMQGILEQDDLETSLSSLHDVIAYHTKASELAAILNEDSPSLHFYPASTAQYHDTPNCNPFQAEPSLDVGSVSSLVRHSTESLVNRVFLLNRLKSSHALDGRHSKVLDVGLFRNLLSTQSLACEQEKTEVSDVDKHSHGGVKCDEAERTGILKARKDPTLGKPRHRQYGSMSSNTKPRSHVEFVDIRVAGLTTDVHLHDMLLQCAYAVGLNNTSSAMALACRVKQQTSPHGSVAERLAYYFVKALYARFQGVGWSLYTGRLSQNRPSSRQVSQARLKYLSNCPFAKASHLFVNQTILRVAKGASSLHIFEHQMTGVRYPALFKELAALAGGPPKVYLVGQIVPHYSMLPAQKDVIYTALEETGRRLSKCAESLNVPFKFTPWVGADGTIDLQHFVSPKRSPDEVVVVISACFMRFVMDDILDPRPLRMKNFKLTKDINPDVFIQGIVSGTYSTPFYSGRFKEALFHFACIYDVLDTFMKRDDQDRLVFESEVLGKAILNIVACEGMSEWGRVENYKQWQAAVEETGMQQLPMDKDMIRNVQSLLESWHKDYLAEEDRQYLLMGWKGRVLYALTAWKSPTRPGYC